VTSRQAEKTHQKRKKVDETSMGPKEKLMHLAIRSKCGGEFRGTMRTAWRPEVSRCNKIGEKIRKGREKRQEKTGGMSKGPQYTIISSVRRIKGQA
jgi:PHP family Zn ribbon phosphoesterase